MADDDKKPWGDDFDEERAWTLVQNLRSDKAALKRERDEARSALTAAEKERDDAVSAKSAAEKDLAADRRAAILREFDISEDDAEEFLPDGLTLDELRRKAERLAGRKKPEDDKGDADDPQAGKDGDDPKDEGKGEEEPKGSDLPGRPKPGLTPGHGASTDDDLDLDAIAASARGR